MFEKILNLKKNFLLLAVLFLLLTNSLTFLLSPKNASNKVQNQFQIDHPLLSPERGFYAQKDLIVNLQPLRDQLSVIGQNPNISIYFEFLSTGANIAINKDQKIWPASLMKLPIAMAIMNKIEDGDLHLNDEVILEQADKNADFGSIYQNSIGTSFTIEKLLEEMLINSDNTARNMLSKKLQTDDLDAVLNHLGIEYDYRNNEQISAKKYSIFWRSLYTSSYLSPENSEKLIEIMSRSSASQYLAGSIPKEIKFSHKIGALYDVNNYADSGIAYVSNRPYILTVMTKDINQADAEKAMQDISQKVYAYISKY